MTSSILQLHPPSVVLENRKRQFITSLEEDFQDLDLIRSIQPERIGLLECSVFDEYQSFKLKTQKGFVDLGTCFEESGRKFILENLQSYVAAQGYEPQALLQMRNFPYELPFTNSDDTLEKKTDSVYIVNDEWLRPEEYAKYIGKCQP